MKKVFSIFQMMLLIIFVIFNTQLNAKEPATGALLSSELPQQEIQDPAGFLIVAHGFNKTWNDSVIAALSELIQSSNELYEICFLEDFTKERDETISIWVEIARRLCVHLLGFGVYAPALSGRAQRANRAPPTMVGRREEIIATLRAQNAVF